MRTVNILPLKNFITLKNVPIPLVFFEKHYLKMLENSIESGLEIAVVPAQDKTCFKGRVAVAARPHILNHRDDGAIDVALFGMRKVKLVNRNQGFPYTSYQTEELFENKAVTVKEDLNLLRELLWAEISKEPRDRGSLKRIFSDPECIINYCTLMLVRDVHKKEKIVSLNSFDEKIEFIINELVRLKNFKDLTRPLFHS